MRPGPGRRASLLFVVVAATLAHHARAQLAVSAARPLTFGSFIAVSGGSVSVDPSGARTGVGGVLLLNAAGGGAATFQVGQALRANTNNTYIISLPENGSVTLGNGPHSMAVNNFVSHPSGTGVLSGGNQYISIGATLTVAPNQAAGKYFGTFSVMFNFQ